MEANTGRYRQVGRQLLLMAWGGWIITYHALMPPDATDEAVSALTHWVVGVVVSSPLGQFLGPYIKTDGPVLHHGTWGSFNGGWGQ